MKKYTTFLFTLLMAAGVYAATQEAQPVSIANYSVRADAPNQAVFYSLMEGDGGRSFNFYIYVEEGKHDIEWGKTYTLGDMNPYYCYWQEDLVTAYGMADATFTKSKGEGYAVNFTAHITDTEGEEFELTYTEDPLVLTGDTVKVTFVKPALIERMTDGTWQVEAHNDTLGGTVKYYSTNEKSCAGTFAGDEINLSGCHVDAFTGKYEFEIPVYDRIFVKDASVQATEADARIDLHTTIVGENGIVYDFTMAFEKPVVEDHVTITSDSLIIDTFGYDMFGTIQLSAADDKHKVIFWYAPEGLDSLIAGTYTVGEKQFDGWVINLETGKETSLFSGSVTVSYDDGAYSVEGAILCKNNVEYTLHLTKAKLTPNREETIVFERVAMSIDEEGWGAYGDNSDHTKFISIFSAYTTIAGHYTEKDLVVDYNFVATDIAPDGSTNKYYDLKEADLTVTFNTTDSVAHITGTMFCINTQDENDRPLFTIDVTTAMDGPYFDDAIADFTADFDTYEINDLMVEDVGSILVEARNDEDAFVALQIFVEEGATRMTAGTYPISNSEAPKTALASRGMYGGYATYSIAGYANESRQFSSVWFLVSGTVTVSESGAIRVEAVNSNGKTVVCSLKQPTGVEDTVEDTDRQLSKSMRDGQLIIRKDGRTYNAQGILIK